MLEDKRPRFDPQTEMISEVISRFRKRWKSPPHSRMRRRNRDRIPIPDLPEMKQISAEYSGRVRPSSKKYRHTDRLAEADTSKDASPPRSTLRILLQADRPTRDMKARLAPPPAEPPLENPRKWPAAAGEGTGTGPADNTAGGAPCPPCEAKTDRGEYSSSKRRPRSRASFTTAKMLAMRGAARTQSIKDNLIIEAGAVVKGRRVAAFSSDQRVQTHVDRDVRLPDVVLVCDPVSDLERDKPVNPQVVARALPVDEATRPRGSSRPHQLLPSIREYVLVAQVKATGRATFVRQRMTRGYAVFRPTPPGVLPGVAFSVQIPAAVYAGGESPTQKPELTSAARPPFQINAWNTDRLRGETSPPRTPSPPRVPPPHPLPAEPGRRGPEGRPNCRRGAHQKARAKWPRRPRESWPRRVWTATGDLPFLV